MPKVKSKSITRNYFEKIDNVSAKCKLCAKVIKVGGGTSNMLAHIKRNHPQATVEVDRGQVGDQPGATQAQETSTSTTQEKPTDTPRPIFQTTLKMTASSSKKKIDKYLTMMIATDFQPYSIVEDKGFRKLVEALNPSYKLPSRQRIRYDLMPELYQCAKLQLASMLENIKNLALTADMWSNQNMDCFLTVTIHFFNQNILKSYVLTTCDVPTSHTGENLAEIMTDLLTEWKILGKISAIVTDNGTNMVKMCNLLGIRHMPCFAHTLNLTLDDSMKLSQVEDITNKCKAIVKFFKKSSVGWRALKLAQKERNPDSTPLKLIQEVSTRWNSTFYMMKRILQLSDILALVCRKLDQAPDYLTASEEEAGREVINILEIFEEATKLVSADQYPTSSLVIPLICGLFEKLNTIEICLTTDIGKMFHSSVRRNISSRLLAYETRTVSQMATYLHPVLKTGFRHPENMQSAKELVRKELSHNLKDCADSSMPSTSEQPGSSTEQKKPGLLDFIKQRRPNTNLTASAVNILRMYLETDPQNEEAEITKAAESAGAFWSSNKHLAPLNTIALKYLAIPATSVPSERMFSKSGYVLSSRRSRLQADAVDQICFINQNYDLLETGKV
ncbi:unnamed protein product [Parnassius apollo]|uniref:(apollo) hypothetical protein n=1 Tax=Parnassius apollo TaxID=110799 RepID=A0A8S3X6I6_PARAO|nr:unnamed protein product [Parnassius apollo]